MYICHVSFFISFYIMGSECMQYLMLSVPFPCFIIHMVNFTSFHISIKIYKCHVLRFTYSIPMFHICMHIKTTLLHLPYFKCHVSYIHKMSCFTYYVPFSYCFVYLLFHSLVLHNKNTSISSL